MPKPLGRAQNPNNKFKCKYLGCDFDCKSSWGLTLHVRSIHEGVSYECGYCKKSFVDKSTLKKHVKTVHVNLKNFKCDECDKSFGQNWILQQHIAIVHRNEKEFKCDHCEKAFGQNGHLKIHMRRVHKM